MVCVGAMVSQLISHIVYMQYNDCDLVHQWGHFANGAKVAQSLSKSPSKRPGSITTVGPNEKRTLYADAKVHGRMVVPAPTPALCSTSTTQNGWSLEVKYPVGEV